MSAAAIKHNGLSPDLRDVVNTLSEPVWVHDPRSGNRAEISPAYKTVLGVRDGEQKLSECIENKDYIKSYDRWAEKGPSNDTWVYPIKWKRPDTGEVLRGYSIARWSNGVIIGRVEIQRLRKLVTPWWLWACFMVIIFSMGFGLGLLVKLT